MHGLCVSPYPSTASQTAHAASQVDPGAGATIRGCGYDFRGGVDFIAPITNKNGKPALARECLGRVCCRENERATAPPWKAYRQLSLYTHPD